MRKEAGGTLSGHTRDLAGAAAALAVIVTSFLVAADTAMAVGEPTNQTPPKITGSPRWGSTLTSSDGSWNSTFPITGYQRQWFRCSATTCTEIIGATFATYTLMQEDVGSRIVVRVIASNAAGNSSPAYSAPTAVVTEDPPDNTARPTFSGTAREGELLTRTSYGTWQNPAPSDYSRQWLRCGSSGNGCAAISGATGDSYRLTSTDVRHTIRLRVRAIGPYGTGQADSTASAVVAAKPVSPAPAPPAAAPEPKPKPKPKRPRRISPFPRILLVGSVSPGGASFRQVVVKGPRGVTVRVRCRGGGCPYGSRRYAMRSRQLRLRSLEHRFRGGAVIEFRVTRRGRIGKYTLIRIRSGRVPGRIDRCLYPGRVDPQRCR